MAVPGDHNFKDVKVIDIIGFLILCDWSTHRSSDHAFVPYVIDEENIKCQIIRFAVPYRTRLDSKETEKMNKVPVSDEGHEKPIEHEYRTNSYSNGCAWNTT